MQEIEISEPKLLTVWNVAIIYIVRLEIGFHVFL